MRRAADISLEVTGQVQGKFKGGSKKKDRKEQIDIWNTNYACVSPRDQATGQATGKRQHHPLVVYTEVEGGAIPQAAAAVFTNETLTSVKLDYWRSDDKGKQSIYFKIELKKAGISELEIFCDEDGRPNAKIAFTFAEIELTWLTGNLMAHDTWHGTT